MAGHTDKPTGHRPNCSECGEHRWSYHGDCLSVECAGPAMERISVTKKTPIVKEELPSWLRTKPSSQYQMSQAVEYCKMMGIERPYPWERIDP